MAADVGLRWHFPQFCWFGLQRWHKSRPDRQRLRKLPAPIGRIRHRTSKSRRIAHRILLAKDGGEASGADGTAQLKNSPSVKWLAHILRVRTATAYQLCIALNFAAMVAVIVWFLGPRLPVWLRNRAQAIRQSLDDAGKASIEAQQRLAAIEARMLKLESEITAMQTVADQESMAEEERFRASAEDDKRKIAAIAEQQILAAVTRAKRDFQTLRGRTHGNAGGNPH